MMKLSLILIYSIHIPLSRMVKMGRFFETSDVYSFGVFLLELITGMDASHMGAFGSSESVVTWVCKSNVH